MINLVGLPMELERERKDHDKLLRKRWMVKQEFRKLKLSTKGRVIVRRHAGLWLSPPNPFHHRRLL